jgi:putative spermidine/putrescine transport system ATP-binding protein
MSDRLAVFDRGRLEQVGTPDGIYDHPATAFVAGFVGVANVCDADLARRLSGAARPFAIRPERIRLVDVDGPAGDGVLTVTGVIDSAQYLGAATRYAVALDGGGQLLVLEQNTGDGGAARKTGQRVRLAWQRRHEQPLR